MSVNEDFFSKILSMGIIKESELKELIEKKKESLGYLITDDVALRLVARDLGVRASMSQINMELKVEDLVPSMRNVRLQATVDKVLTVREFKKKNGGVGKVCRVIVKDETGTSILVLWDDKAEYAHKLKVGTRIQIRYGYTKAGLNGSLEIHIGDRGGIDIIENGSSNSTLYKGRIWKVFDVIEFEKKNGDKGKMVSFLLKTDGKILRVLVWNPTGTLVSNLVEGGYVEIFEGELRKNSREEDELHVNDEKNIILNPKDVIQSDLERNRLSEIKPGMENLTVEGIIDDVFYGETYNGKKFVKLVLKDDEASLPLIFWDHKADLIKQIAKPGLKLQVNGCYSKIGPNGLEVVASKWSKIKVK